MVNSIFSFHIHIVYWQLKRRIIVFHVWNLKDSLTVKGYFYLVSGPVALARHSRYSWVAAQQQHQQYRIKSVTKPPRRPYFSLTLLRFHAHPAVHRQHESSHISAQKSTQQAVQPPSPSMRFLFSQWTQPIPQHGSTTVRQHANGEFTHPKKSSFHCSI